jgi:NADP-dependent 3-hydroxy acid dehydrogenase YdfG
MTNPEVKTQTHTTQDKIGISPNAIARAIVFAIDLPADVDVNEIVVRPTARA